MTTEPNNHSPSSIYQTKPKKKSFFAKPVFWLSLLVIILIAVAGFLIVDKFTNQSAANPTGASQPSTADNASSNSTVLNNAFGQEATKIGAKKCAALFSNMGENLVSGSSFDMIASGTEQAGDENPISAITGQVYTSNNGRGSGVVFASPLGNGCAGMLTRTILQMQSCAEIAQQLPAGSERLKDLAATAAFHLPNNFNVLLMPASETSCIIISTINLTDKK